MSVATRAAASPVLLSLVALAQDHESALQEGQRLRDGGDLAAARAKFEEAMRLAPDASARAVAESWVAETAELFADYCKRAKDGEPKLEAFTEARKALRKKYPDPHFWAPFVFIGDPR